ncbi:hypothetical protein AB0G73_30670 [Streptomyces sp. NPDC020719]|uniref:hypothetical protein n=1 Tax=Streptomyces sp. NPDC020719 TaxID=3154896 RepID=UPI0033C11FED
MRRTVSVIALLSCLPLAACTSSHMPSAVPGIRSVASTPSATSSTAPAAAGDGDGVCTIYLYRHAARVEVHGSGESNPAAECGSLASSLSTGGDFWTTQAAAVQGLVPEVCAVHRNDVMVVVRDINSQIFGQSVCSALLQGGWTEDAQAERTAQQRDQATVRASAQASAQVADQQTAQDALTTLQGSNNSFNNAKSVRGDVGTADKDLAQEQQDAKAGNGEGCYNVENVVGYDAENVVGYDVTVTAGYDVDQEKQGITRLRSQITALKNAQTALTSDGLPTLSGAGTAIATAEGHITTTIGTTNKAIDHLNADMQTAYSIANALGTGDCANTGPGTAPAELLRIS